MDSNTNEKSELKKWEIAGYGLGGFTSTLPNQFKTQFGMSFMSDVAGIPVGTVGTLSMLMTIWDAINDPIIGHIADNTNSKRFGRYRPHMLLGSIGLCITVLLMFLVPPFSGLGRLIYYGIVLALFSVFFTQFTVPWQALNSIMSTDPHARNKLLVSRQLIGAVATSMVGLFTAPLVTHFSNVKTGWFAAACVVAVLLIVSALCSVASAKRSDQYRPNASAEKKQSFFTQLTALKGNKAVIFASLMMGIVNFGISVNAGISMYYMRCVVGNVKVLAVISGIQILVSLLLVPFLPKVLRRFGKLPVLRASMVLQAVAAVALMLLREHATVPQVILISAFSTTGLTFANICCFSLLPDCTDYCKLNYGSAQAGFINAICTFMRKLCGSFSTLVIGGLLSIVGYDAALPIAQAWIDMIVDIKVAVPLVSLVAVFACSFFYPISAKYAAEMHKKLQSSL